MSRFKTNVNAVHIGSRLKINHLANNLNNIILSECMKQIIVLFGGYKSMLCFITKCADHKQLQSIYEIIKQQQQKLKHKKNNDINCNKLNNKSNDNINNNAFETLPNECISYVCGYLTKYDIEIFKKTSRQIAIVCLEEMNKINVGVINGNNLMHNTQVNLYDFACSSLRRKVIMSTRFKISKRYETVFEYWSYAYNIPEENQLIWSIEENRVNKKIILKMINHSLLRTVYIENEQYLMCDNRNIVILENNNVRKFNIEKDAFKKMKDYTLMVLQYFDIDDNSLNIVQILLCKDDVSKKRILQYVENEYIEISSPNIDNRWYKKLQQNFKDMFCNDGNDKDKGIKKLKQKFKKRKCSMSDNLFTFQLRYPTTNSMYPREININGKNWSRRHSSEEMRYFWNSIETVGSIGSSWNPWSDNGLIAPWILKDKTKQKWTKFHDDSSVPYWYNKESHKSTYKRPDGYQTETEINYDSRYDDSDN